MAATVLSETTCSVEADWHLVTAYKCSLVKNKYVPDFEYSLSDDATRKLFLGFLETLFPIQQACLSDNFDKEAIAGQQGNNLARQSFDLMPFPSDWLRPAKLGYVIIYQSNALISAYQVRDKIASVLDELGWEASYTDVAEKMQPWLDERKEKATSKKKKSEVARNAKKAKKGGKAERGEQEVPSLLAFQKPLRERETFGGAPQTSRNRQALLRLRACGSRALFSRASR